MNESFDTVKRRSRLLDLYSNSAFQVLLTKSDLAWNRVIDQSLALGLKMTDARIAFEAKLPDVPVEGTKESTLTLIKHGRARQ